MPIDSSIYFQNQGPDILGSVDRGLRMADLIGERRQKQAEQQKAQAIDQAHANALVMNPDGTMSYSPEKAAQNLAKAGFGREGLQLQEQIKAKKIQEQSNALDIRKKTSDFLGPRLARVTDQKTYQQLYNEFGNEFGPEALRGVPSQYDPNYIKSLKDQYGISKEELEQQKTKSEIAKNYAETRNKGIAPLKNRDIEYLPAEDRKVVEDLSGSNAKKASIASQIDAVVNIMKDPNSTYDQKLQQGRQLIKTLNSTQGPDAVGAEESKRLANKLEFAFGNLLGGSPRVGRDLEGFITDAEMTSKGIKSSIKAQTDIIKKAYERVGISKNPSEIYDFETKNDQTQITPKQVIQNGHTYILNEATGEYE